MPAKESFPQISAPIRRLIRAFWTLAALESAGALLYLVLIPADAKNALILGFSGSRLMLMGVIAAGLVFFLASAIRPSGMMDKLVVEPLKVQRKLFTLTLLLATLFWQVSFLPSYRLGVFLAYFQRLQPLLIWLTFLLIQTALLFIAARLLQAESGDEKTGRTSTITAFAVTMGGFLVFWLIVLATGLGIGAGNNYWNKVGVPILGVQIIAAVLLGIVLLFIEERVGLQKLIQRKPWLVDLTVFLLIWGAGALCMLNTPIAPSRFNTQPAPPNFASYPFSDAEEYDLTAQGVLQGKNINFAYVDKPLHLVFLVIVHLLGGQDFNRVIPIQVLLLAVMPALLYLLGKLLFNRTAGVTAAVLAIFYQVNAIQATNLIQVSNVKMMMSEPLTAIGVIAVCLLAVKWLKSPLNWWQNLMMVAGAVGIGSLIRLNVAALMLVITAAAAVQLKWRWKRVLWAIVLASVFYVLALSPWIVRNAVVADNPILFLKNKIHGVIWRKRLSPIIQVSPTTVPLATPEPGGSAAPPSAAPDDDHGLSAALWPLASNYAHNLASTILMVPPLLEQGDLEESLRAPYWDSEWDGRFTTGGVALLVLNMAVVSIGAAGAWRRRRMAGLFPLLSLLAYHLTNALAVVSGGRYIVAVDWVIYFYFAFGLAEIVFFLLKLFNMNFQPAESNPAFLPPPFELRLKSIIPAVSCLLLIGSLPWAVESAFPEIYPARPAEQVLAAFNSTVDWEETGVTAAEVKTFLAQQDAVLIEGQAFYPRFFEPGLGDTGSPTSPFGVKDYPHFGFALLGEARNYVNIYLEQSPAHFDNSADAIVLGCLKDGVVQAVAVTTLSPNQTFIRPDLHGLKCYLGGPD